MALKMSRKFRDIETNEEFEEIGYHMRDRDGSALLTIKQTEREKEEPYFLMMGCDWIGGSDILKLGSYSFTPLQAKAVAEAIEEVMLEITNPTDKLYDDGNFVKKVNKAREAIR